MAAAPPAPSPASFVARWRGHAAVRLRGAELRVVGVRVRQAGVLAVATGVATGLLVALFDRLVARGVLVPLFRSPLWVQALAPGLGLAVAAVLLRTIGRGASPSTSDEYLKAFHEPDGRVGMGAVPARMLASAVTLGSGGALGFEGPSIYLGSAIGSWIQARWSRAFASEDTKLLMVCGAAAGVAAIFKAPATGVVFALEVPYRQDLARRMLLPAMFSAAASYVVYAAINGTSPLFPVGGSPPFDLRDLGGAAILGLLAGVGARLVARVLRQAKALAAAHPVWLRVPVAAIGLVLALLASHHLSGQTLSVGPGYRTINWALRPGHALGVLVAIFAIRMLATALAVGAGGVGGLFVPLVVQGALLGAAVGSVVHASDPTFFPLLGVAAFLGAGYRVPLAAVVFVAETSGRPGFVVPGLIAAATSQLLMGESSVTPYQVSTRRSSLGRRLALPVAAALRTDAASVPSDATLAELFDHHVGQLRLRSVPVVDGSTCLGMVSLPEVAAVPRADWATTAVADVVRTDWPRADLTWNLGQAVEAMDRAEVDRLPVLDGEGYVGLVTRGEILKLDAILDSTERMT